MPSQRPTTRIAGRRRRVADGQRGQHVVQPAAGDGRRPAAPRPAPTSVSQQPRRPHRHRRPAGLTVMCPISPRVPAGAGQRPPAEDEPAADADLAGQVDRVRGAGGDPAQVLGDHAEVALVAHRHRQPRCRARRPATGRAARPPSRGWAPAGPCRRRRCPAPRRPPRPAAVPAAASSGPAMGPRAGAAPRPTVPSSRASGSSPAVQHHAAEPDPGGRDRCSTPMSHGEHPDVLGPRLDQDRRPAGAAPADRWRPPGPGRPRPARWSARGPCCG